MAATVVWALGLDGAGLLSDDRVSSAVMLVDVTAASGIDFQHFDGGSGRDYLPELMVAGLAIFDYDDDGWLDVYFLNGARLPAPTGEPAPRGRPRNALYRNLGHGRFMDVTDRAGVGDTGHGLGVVAGDYDNDGDADLYLTNFGANVFLRNAGDGTFEDATVTARLPGGEAFGAGTCFLDSDADGLLDLYVGRYVDFRFDRFAQLAPRSFPFPPGPRDFAALPDGLYRNLGDGRFQDVSVAAGIAAVAGPTMGVISGDYDDDRDSDVFVCCDGRPNLLFQNDGRGRFREVGLAAGVAVDGTGLAKGSMGVDCGDVDGDGRLELFVTDYAGELPLLFQNQPGGFFADVTNQAGAGASVFPHTNWGAGLVDFDNDGDRDMFIANGHFLRNPAAIGDTTAFQVANTLLLNDGRGRFTDVSERSGSGLAVVESSRGAAFGDVDRDGDVDAIVLNANSRPTVIENVTSGGNQWVAVRLRGVTGNRDGVGSRVRVVTAAKTYVAEVHAGRGYQSHYGTEVHFGLGRAATVRRVEVAWHGGPTEIFPSPPSGRQLVLIEGTGKPAPVP